MGLTAALALAKKQVPITVLEAEPELPKELRASTFHPPTLEMLDELGLTEKLIAQGLIADKFQFRDTKAGKIAEFDLAVLKDDTRYPFRLQLEQYALSVLAYEALQRLPNADVRFGHKVVNTVPAQDHVAVIAETPEGRRQFMADYVIGADGAHSEVRRAMGIPFEGMTYPELYLVQFTTFDFLERIPDLAHVNYVFSDEDWFVLLHSPGVWRILFPMRPEEAALDALPDDATLELRGQACLQKVVATGQPYPVVHRAIYQVHQRVAQSYRSGYVLLAGDAAHVNNPPSNWPPSGETRVSGSTAWPSPPCAPPPSWKQSVPASNGDWAGSGSLPPTGTGHPSRSAWLSPRPMSPSPSSWRRPRPTTSPGTLSALEVWLSTEPDRVDHEGHNRVNSDSVRGRLDRTAL